MQNDNFEKFKNKIESEELRLTLPKEIKEGDYSIFLEAETKDNQSKELKGIGVSNEIAKSSYRGKVLIWLATIITAEILFINFIFYKMVFNETYISDTAFKYFISGIFVNLIVMFRAIMNYLYNNSTSSILDLFFKKQK